MASVPGALFPTSNLNLEKLTIIQFHRLKSREI